MSGAMSARTAAARARAALTRRAALITARPTTVGPGEAALIAHPRAAAAALGRLGRLPAGPVTAAGQGNTVVRSDARGQSAAQPGKGPGTPVGDLSPYPARVIVTPPSQLLRAARTPGFQNGKLIARDRHILSSTGMITGSGANPTEPGVPNPDAWVFGPPRPSFRMLNRTISWQIGAGFTRGLDNTAPKPSTAAGGRRFPLGTQGDPYSVVYGGTPGLAAYRPYGTRGGPSQAAPAPTVIALPGGPYRPGTVLSAGSPQDGPQKLPGGPPWGLHSPTAAAAASTRATQRARIGQLRPPRVNRPLNSKASGQSYDQQVVHLDGSQAVQVPKISGGRQPGLNQHWRH